MDLMPLGIVTLVVRGVVVIAHQRTRVVRPGRGEDGGGVAAAAVDVIPV